MKSRPKNLEEVSISIPKNLLNMVRACFKDPTRYLQYRSADVIRADFESQDVVLEGISEKYNLKETFARALYQAKS